MVYAPSYPIETTRLRLRPFTRGDVDAVFDYRRREDVARYLFDGALTHEACTEIVRLRVAQVELAAEGDKIVLAVEVKATARLVGEVSLIWRDRASRQGEIGFILHPDAQGVGFATEAAAAMLDLGFDGLGLHRIYARCVAANRASYAVMQRLGMRQEAHFREHSFLHGAWQEEYICAILAAEWCGRS